MLTADLTGFARQGLTATLLITGHGVIWEIAALQALHGVATAFFNPAATGLTPQVVSAERLHDANGLWSLAMSGSGIAGPAIAALLVTGVGAGWALGGDALTFLISAACLAGLRLPARVKLPPQSFLRDLRDGWSEFSSRTWAWALILGALSVGGLLGGLAVLRVRLEWPLRAGVIAVLPWSVPTALLALRVPALGIAAVAVASGAGLMFFTSLWETTLQRHVPHASLSRVIAYDWFGSLLMQPIGFALVGPAVGLFGQTRTLWIAFAVQLASCLLMLVPASVRRLTSDEVPAHLAESALLT